MWPCREFNLRVFSRLRFYIVSCVLFAPLLACSAKSYRERMYEEADRAHPRGAAYAADGMFYDKDQPERDAPVQNFFHKHCELQSRKNYLGLGDYLCEEQF